jgi:hypothetical protein
MAKVTKKKKEKHADFTVAPTLPCERPILTSFRKRNSSSARVRRPLQTLRIRPSRLAVCFLPDVRNEPS